MNKKAILSLAVLPLVLGGSNIFATAADEVGVEKKTFDYSTTNNTSIIDGKTLLRNLKYKNKTDEEIASDPLIQAEMEYVDSRYELKYDLFPSNVVPFNYGSVTSNYYVEGFELGDFSPKYVNYNNQEYNFEEVNYQQIATVENTQNLEGAEVVYNHTINIDTFAAYEIVNAAYEAALEQKAIQDKIEQFDAYDTYLNKVKKLDEYNVAKEAARIKNQNIKLYDAAREAYDSELAVYNKYIEEDLPDYNKKVSNYKQYLLATETYNSNLDKIAEAEQKYIANMELVEYQLGLMEYFYAGKERFPGVEAGGSIFSYIFRNAVSMVTNESNEYLFTTAGISKDIMARARNSTERLQDFLTKYNQLRQSNDSNATKAKYDFFMTNGKRIKENLVALTQCLEKFFRNQNVKNEMEKRGKTERYTFLLAELIYVSSLFTQNSFDCYDKVYSGASANTYTINSEILLDGVKANEVLGVDPLVTENLKSSAPLRSYPVTAESIYGKRPILTDYNLSETDLIEQDGVKIIKPLEVIEKPIEPTLQDFGLKDRQEAPNVRLADYGLVEADLDANGKIKPVDKPSGEKPSRDSQFDVFYNALKAEQLKNCTVFEGCVVVEERIPISDSRVHEQEIAVMHVEKPNPHIHEIAFFDEGSSPTLKHEIPPVETSVSGIYDYFRKWHYEEDYEDYELAHYTESVNITAVILTGDLDTYVVKFFEVGESEPLLTTIGFQYYKPAFIPNTSNGKEVTPTKESTDTEKYIFKGFSYNGVDVVSELKPCEEYGVDPNGTITIYVLFTTVPLYCVNFYDSDIDNNPTTILETYKGLEEGTAVGYDSPSRKEDDLRIRKFDYWYLKGDPEKNPVDLPYIINKDVGSVEFVAFYSTTLKYKVNFMDEGVKLYDNDVVYLENEIPNTPVNKGKSFDLLANKYYEFDKWIDANGNGISKLTGDNTETIIYTAKYDEYQIVKNAAISENSTGDTLIFDVDASVHKLSFAKFNQLVGSSFDYENLKINFDNITLVLSNTQVKQLYTNNVDELSYVFSKNENGEITFKLEAKEAAELKKLDNGISATVIFDNQSEIDHMRAYVGDRRVLINDLGNGCISINANINETIDLAIYYLLSFDAMSNSTYLINGEEVNTNEQSYYKKGSHIQLKASGTTGYDVEGINLNGVSAGENVTDSYELVISGDTLISTKTKKKMFTITLLVDGETQTYTAEYGSIFILEDPTKEDTDYYQYKFTGWYELGNDEKSIVVTDNITLTAVFEEIIKINGTELMDSSKELVKTIISIVLILLGVGLLFLLFFIIFANRKHEDNESDDEDEELSVPQKVEENNVTKGEKL